MSYEKVLARNKQSIEFLRTKNTKRKIPRTKLRYPKTTELDYVRSIKVLNRFLIDAVKTILVPRIPNIYATFQSDMMLDNYKDILDATMEEVSFKVNGIYSDNNVDNIVFKYANETNKANYNGINKQAMEVLGINLFASEPWLETVTDAWIAENVALIKSIPTQYLTNLEFYN